MMSVKWSFTVIYAEAHSSIKQYKALSFAIVSQSAWLVALVCNRYLPPICFWSGSAIENVSPHTRLLSSIEHAVVVTSANKNESDPDWLHLLSSSYCGINVGLPSLWQIQILMLKYCSSVHCCTLSGGLLGDFHSLQQKEGHYTSSTHSNQHLLFLMIPVVCYWPEYWCNSQVYS